MNEDNLKTIIQYANNPQCILVCELWKNIMYNDCEKCEHCNKIIRIYNKMLYTNKYPNKCHTKKSFIIKDTQLLRNIDNDFFVMMRIFEKINNDGYVKNDNNLLTFSVNNNNIISNLIIIANGNTYNNKIFKLNFKDLYNFKSISTEIPTLQMMMNYKHNNITYFDNYEFNISTTKKDGNYNYDNFNLQIPLVKDSTIPMLNILDSTYFINLSKDRFDGFRRMSYISKYVTIKHYHGNFTFKTVSHNKMKYVIKTHNFCTNMKKITIEINNLLLFDCNMDTNICIHDGKLWITMRNKTYFLNACITPI